MKSVDSDFGKEAINSEIESILCNNTRGHRVLTKLLSEKQLSANVYRNPSYCFSEKDDS